MNQITNELELMWAAGFFDGEGNARSQLVENQYRKTKTKTYGPYTYRQVHIQVRQADREPLERLQKVLGGAIRGPFKNGSPLAKKPVYIWDVNAWEEVQRVANLLLPRVSSIKRTQIEKALSEFIGGDNANQS